MTGPAEALRGALEMFCPGRIEAGETRLLDEGEDPLAGLPRPLVVASAGQGLLAMPLAGARSLAAAMGQEADDDELSAGELAAISQAAGQALAASASAAELEDSPPEVVVVGADDPLPSIDASARALVAPVVLAGSAGVLVQGLPEPQPDADLPRHDASILARSLADVPVRVWAELGRSRMPAARVIDLSPGTVVDLDREVEEPVDLYVNGLPFARGRLVVTEGSDWAVQIETVIGDGSA